MIDTQVAFDKLSQFQTTEDLRAFFVASNIKGDKNAAFSCPIATYMEQQTGIRFGADQCTIDGYAENERLETFETTPALGDFMDDFDHGYYPELVRKGDWYL